MNECCEIRRHSIPKGPVVTRSVEIPDAVVATAELAYWAAQEGVPVAERCTTGMRAALVAARPYLMPELDREKVKRALGRALGASKGVLATTHQNHGFDSGCPVCRGKADEIAEQVVDDLLALLSTSGESGE